MWLLPRRCPTPSISARDHADIKAPFPQTSSCQWSNSELPNSEGIFCVFLLAGKPRLVFQDAKCGTDLWWLHVGKRQQRTRGRHCKGIRTSNKLQNQKTKRTNPTEPLGFRAAYTKKISCPPWALFRTKIRKAWKSLNVRYPIKWYFYMFIYFIYLRLIYTIVHNH